MSKPQRSTSPITLAEPDEVLAFGTAGAEPVSVDSGEETLDPRALLETIKALQSQVGQLQAAQAETARKVDADYDMTDDYFFLGRPGGERWEERRIVDKRTVSVEMVATAFYGPFTTKEDIEAYLSAKRRQRNGEGALDWASVRIMNGREARALRNRERQDREEQFGEQGHVNVLDRKIFASAHGGHQPTLGALVGPAA